MKVPVTGGVLTFGDGTKKSFLTGPHGEERPYHVVCTKCGAKYGFHCKSKRLNRVVQPHAERRKLAIRTDVLVALKDGSMRAKEVAKAVWPWGKEQANARNAALLLWTMQREGLVIMHTRRWGTFYEARQQWLQGLNK